MTAALMAMVSADCPKELLIGENSAVKYFRDYETSITGVSTWKYWTSFVGLSIIEDTLKEKLVWWTFVFSTYVLFNSAMTCLSLTLIS